MTNWKIRHAYWARVHELVHVAKLIIDTYFSFSKIVEILYFSIPGKYLFFSLKNSTSVRKPVSIQNFAFFKKNIFDFGSPLKTQQNLLCFLKQSFYKLITILMMWRRLHSHLNYLWMHMRSKIFASHKNGWNATSVRHSSHCSFYVKDCSNFHRTRWKKIPIFFRYDKNVLISVPKHKRLNSTFTVLSSFMVFLLQIICCKLCSELIKISNI